MSGPPKGTPWVWLTRDLLRSPAWRGLGINARRLVDFLLVEHMNHGGKSNGFLLAPRYQLEEAGIGHRHITAAIDEARAAQLITVKRGAGRRPSTFALAWLPLAGSEGNLQRAVAGSEGDRQGGPKGTYKGRSRVRREPTKAEINRVRRDPPYRSSYQGSSYSNGLDEREAARAPPNGAAP